ncbi:MULTISPECIES: LysR family transcriptional regulator [unclassified Streptomyces]|uniref:LysR family transcriptional regulator n=1 Tax=unclassified Streptomyces TaxID=2593676 RepID=UPI0008239377|nr:MULTISPECIES: LysR family transcriptional regulator [unclassified Streptomyces]AWN25483.1 LysR family transcriptional regulator [Streptomyces sp. NEAU-S7GS2]MYT14572.1 LysR family transcriptional regulator [Streptomyces sp. SID4951]SCK14902.1 DNA-binding transcriptional regulator, LysR family [Streptomyces sp. SceaMP-e96]
MITWERLRVFAAVARLGSVGEAAAVLHITGPAVSQHLRKLEKEVQCRLVERDGRGIRLTSAGHILARSAQAMVTTLDDAERDLANLHGLVAGPLRIGGVASALRALVPPVLSSLITRHPRLEPSLRDGEAVDMIPMLQARQLDAVVTESWTHRPAHMPPGIRITRLVYEDAQLAVPEGHPLADREFVALSDLHGEFWTTCPEGSDAHEALLQLLRAHEVEAEVRYCVSDYATQLHLVAAGLAVTLVPRMVRESAPPGVCFVPCRPTVTRSVVVATAADAETPGVRAFMAEMIRVAYRTEPSLTPHAPRKSASDEQALAAEASPDTDAPPDPPAGTSHLPLGTDPAPASSPEE